MPTFSPNYGRQKEPIRIIYRKPKRRQVTYDVKKRPKIEQPTMGPENVGLPQGKVNLL